MDMAGHLEPARTIRLQTCTLVGSDRLQQPQDVRGCNERRENFHHPSPQQQQHSTQHTPAVQCKLSHVASTTAVCCTVTVLTNDEKILAATALEKFQTF